MHNTLKLMSVCHNTVIGIFVAYLRENINHNFLFFFRTEIKNNTSWQKEILTFR